MDSALVTRSGGRSIKAQAALLLSLVLAACSGDSSRVPPSEGADADGHGTASPTTVAANARVAEALAELPGVDDFSAAERGLIATAGPLQVPGLEGMLAWDRSSYDFIVGDAPDTVHPSLWRQEHLNNRAGLFKVSEGIYQLRGFDLANMTLISGAEGWIVVDPLTTVETARAALAFARQHLDQRPVTAVVFTHSHIDHFGGIHGVVTPEAIANGAVEIVAPGQFMAEATSELVLAGRVMGRRADYMFGRRLTRSPRGPIGSGLGKQPAIGTLTIAAPTLTVAEDLERHTVDGVDFVFQVVSGSEAPSEFVFYLPKWRALCGAELVSRNLHNLYTLRGAKVRDALAWSGFIEATRRQFPDTEVLFNSHHWPVWGSADIQQFLMGHRDIYRYIHDQTLRLAGQGMTPTEIADAIELPESLKRSFPLQGYYGTVRHNSRAVYQFYFGWYDANPANLNPLTPVQAGRRYVELLGGADRVLSAARVSYAEGDYRWVAELLNHVVFAEPDHTEARALLADTYDQLGYQASSGPWRDVYLSGAYELRNGPPETPLPTGSIRSLLRETPVDRVMELLATLVDGPAAAGNSLVLNFTITDLGRNFVLRLENAVLHHREEAPADDASVTINVSHAFLLDLLLGSVDAATLLTTNDLDIEGSRVDLVRFLSLLQVPDGTFAIVTP